ncbi:hypothetical protein JCM14076_03980 [Methylosoma difficile]
MPFGRCGGDVQAHQTRFGGDVAGEKLRKVVKDGRAGILPATGYKMFALFNLLAKKKMLKKLADAFKWQQ